jgi:hypothetical protein
LRQIASAISRALIGRHHVVHQPVAERPGRVEAPARHQQLQRDPLGQHPRQPLRAAGARDDRARHLRHAELGVLRGDADVARDRDLQPAGQAVAVDRGDDRLPALKVAGDAAERRARHLTRVAPLSGHHLGHRHQVVAGGEGAFAGAGEDGDPEVGVVAEVAEGGVQLVAGLGVDGVQPVRAVDRDQRQVSLLLVEDPLEPIGHRRTSWYHALANG